MNVVATAGHVDHGKSTLIHALTGMHPDRLATERQRGLSIELGFAWTDLEHCGTVAFVDVPGHERFVPTMLSGIGPVGGCLFVVAADDGWMPQAAEHLAALDALGVSHGVIAVTRSDLADPSEMMAAARTATEGTGLAEAPIVAVSATTGSGVGELRTELARMLSGLPTPRPDADVRLWLDRVFSMKGMGTVVTGTLPSGTLEVGDVLESQRGPMRIRQMQCMGTSVAQLTGPARVALNLSGDAGGLHRGDALWQPHAWWPSVAADVRIVGQVDHRPPRGPMLHVGSAAVDVRSRPLDDRHLRLQLPRQLPLRQGDRGILRDPGDRRLWGVVVLDPDPPALTRRGAARAQANRLAHREATPSLNAEIAYRGIIAASALRALGMTPPNDQEWFLSPEQQEAATAEITRLVIEHDRAHPDDPGVALTILADQLSLPSASVVSSIVRPPLSVSAGRARSTQDVTLSPRQATALDALDSEFSARPFVAPTANRLRELGLARSDLRAAERARRIFRPSPEVVLPADAVPRAIETLGTLAPPFTTSDARRALETSRRVAIPLLTYLDRIRVTKRFADDTRRLLASSDSERDS